MLKKSQKKGGKKWREDRCRAGSPSTMVWGWSLKRTSFSASRSSSPASTVTEVVPSPTSSSWDLEISYRGSVFGREMRRKDSPTRTLAAGLSKWMDFKMVAPSFVTDTPLPLPIDCRILSWEESDVVRDHKNEKNMARSRNDIEKRTSRCGTSIEDAKVFRLPFLSVRGWPSLNLKWRWHRRKRTV